MGWTAFAVVVACAVASRRRAGLERLNRLKVNSSYLAILATSVAIAAVAVVESTAGRCETAGPWLLAATFVCTAVVLVNQMLAFEAPHAHAGLREEPALSKAAVRAAAG